jgi:hypothetical protein
MAKHLRDQKGTTVHSNHAHENCRPERVHIARPERFTHANLVEGPLLESRVQHKVAAIPTAVPGIRGFRGLALDPDVGERLIPTQGRVRNRGRVRVGDVQRVIVRRLKTATLEPGGAE